MAGRILLTGAGFSKGFGGFLATELWSWLINTREVRDSRLLRELLKANFDFELAYSSISDEAARQQMATALAHVYDRQERPISAALTELSRRARPTKTWPLVGFLDAFSAGHGKDDRGYFFTLNQDLFVERLFRDMGASARLIVPGVPGHLRSLDFGFGQRLTLPTERQTQALQDNQGSLLEKQVAYVKLHGSMNWSPDSGAMNIVIGSSKEDGIRDRHVNEVIAKRAQSPGLRLFIIDPASPAELRHRLDTTGRPHGELIWQAVHGYFPWPLEALYPRESLAETEMAREVRRTLEE